MSKMYSEYLYLEVIQPCNCGKLIQLLIIYVTTVFILMINTIKTPKNLLNYLLSKRFLN